MRDERWKALREKLRATKISLDLSEVEDEILDLIIEEAIEQHEDEGGYCSYEWHISPGEFEPGKDECEWCGGSRSEHRPQEFLMCPDNEKESDEEKE